MVYSSDCMGVDVAVYMVVDVTDLVHEICRYGENENEIQNEAVNENLSENLYASLNEIVNVNVVGSLSQNHPDDNQFLPILNYRYTLNMDVRTLQMSRS